MDQIHRSVHGAGDIDQLMKRALDTTRAIFNSDRAWLLYPCDPRASTWRIPMESRTPDLPDLHGRASEIELDTAMASALSNYLGANGPIKSGEQRCNDPFDYRAAMAMTLHPKGDKPWLFGIHQVQSHREWKEEEVWLFQEIGRRLTDCMASLAAYRDLEKSEERYRPIVETANEGVWMIGADSKTTFANARMAAMVGYTVEEMLGQPTYKFMYENEFKDYERTQSERARGDSNTFERRLKHKNGEMIWAHVSATPLLDDEDRFLGSFGMFTDITERKQTEAELIQAKEAAESAARTRSQFLDIAAHELRSPVTALELSLDVAQMQMEKGKRMEAELLARFRRQTHRLSRLVRDLLDVSRLENGKVNLQVQPVEVVALIQAMVDEFQQQAPNRHIGFSRPREDVVLHVDPIRLQQVLSNLLDNALKYTPDHCRVDVKLEQSANGVSLSVIDNGPGIPEEQQRELFKPFTRGRSDREDRAGGLGLGLVVCEGIVKLHGGRITLRSQPGLGSTFSIELPHEVLHDKSKSPNLDC